MSTRNVGVLVLALTLAVGACRSAGDHNLTIYSGRSKSLVEPVVAEFTRLTGIAVDMRYGDTAELVVALMEEGEHTRADLFWAQDAGALGAASEAGLLSVLPDSILGRVQPDFRSSTGRWVATSGRARTIAYSIPRVAEGDLPSSVFDLTDPRFEGRVGWAPANGSFQAFVTAMRLVHGDDRTREWLIAMRDNGTVSYPKNTAIIQGIANGEVDFGLPNHYYLYRFKQEDPDYPVAQRNFAAGDIGNLINVAGIGVLSGATDATAAHRFVDHALAETAQRYFASETFEYPVAASVEAVSLPPDSLLPAIELDRLKDLDATLNLLREIGLL